MGIAARPVWEEDKTCSKWTLLHLMHGVPNERQGVVEGWVTPDNGWIGTRSSTDVCAEEGGLLGVVVGADVVGVGGACVDIEAQTQRFLKLSPTLRQDCAVGSVEPPTPSCYRMP